MNNAVILAGGESRRMGRDKLKLPIGGRTLLDSAASRFAKEFKDVYISVAQSGKYTDIAEGAQEIVDIIPGAGPISGLHAALSNVPGDGVFLVAADLPFSCPHTAKRIIELSGDADACIIRMPNGRVEPLFGYYRKTMLTRCEDAIKSGNHRMTSLLSDANVRFVAPSELGGLWDEKIILNINYPEEYEKAALEFLR